MTGNRTPRIGVLGLWHESNSFVPTRTNLEMFEMHAGPGVRDRWTGQHSDLGGFFAGLDDNPVEAVPLFSASATPSGEITSAACEALLDRALTAIGAVPTLDGLLMAAHGAAVCEEHPDADGWWLRQIRAAVGQIPIIATLDAHANVSNDMVDATDALVAYRTNPHLDTFDRGMEAAHLMLRAVAGEVALTQAAVFPPLAINVLLQDTRVEPCASIGMLMDEVRSEPDVLSASFCLGYRFADVVENGASVVVVTDASPQEATEHARRVGSTLMSERERFVARLVGVDEAVSRASSATERVCLLDTGDNIGGGSAGDGTILAKRILESPIESGFVAIYDPTSVAAAASAGVGKSVKLEVGAKTDDLHGSPITTSATVLSLHEGKFFEEAVRHAGLQEFDMGHTAIVACDGLTVQLTSLRVMPFSIGQLTSCGLDPTDFDVIVAKGTNAPIPAYAPYCPTILKVATPGSTRADMENLPYRRRRRPLFPFEPVTDVT